MTKLYLTFIFSLLLTFSKAQHPDFTADLNHLYAALKKTPSYKDQITGERKKEYKKLYESLKNEASAVKTDLDYFIRLSRLLLPLKDNHLGFYQYSPFTFQPGVADTALVNRFKKTSLFLNYPRANVDLDSLQNVLNLKPRDSVEGIYSYGKYVKAGLFRSSQRKDSLVAVVLDSKSLLWEPGDIVFFLNESQPNHFSAYHADIFQMTFSLNKNIKYQHASLSGLNFKKPSNERDYVNLTNTPTFQYRQLDNNIQYLRLGSFSASNKALLESQKFYNRIQDSMTSKFLIVDLRNNGGGAFKASGKYLNLLKRYSRHGRIYAIVNNKTVSNAEQFTIQLKKIKNITVLGESTNGMLAYGNNTGKRVTLPGGKFKLYITDMKDRGKYLLYEGAGVSPDIYLQPDSNWINQVVHLVNSRN